MSFSFTPTVNQSQEFLEIAGDFSNPLDIVREAISNSFDAEAKHIKILFESNSYRGRFELKVTLEDDGHGMDEPGLHTFFDLGNSMRKGDPSKIGEKGHGTKVYFNCDRKIVVTTVKDGTKYIATMDYPRDELFENRIPSVNVETATTEDSSGTKIEIYGYNNSRRERFSHLEIKDFIMWRTKFGSIEKEFGILDNQDVTLELKGIDRDSTEVLSFGHFFPNENSNINRLFDLYFYNAPDYYCKKIVKHGALPNMPEIRYDMVFCIEGNQVKYSYNEMIRRQGYTVNGGLGGGYTVQERYGLYLCKDYIPVAQKNEWINSKGSESTRIHAFINCQALRLTANRGSVENTEQNILDALQKVVKEFFAELKDSNDWKNMDYLASQIAGEKTIENERRDFKNRIAMVNKSKICKYTDNTTGKTVTLQEPINENGVYGLFLQMNMVDETLFPFYIVDYNTHEGIDVIVVDRRKDLSVNEQRSYYVEFKKDLNSNFNHGFDNLHSIICWQLGNDIQDREEISDVTKRTRILEISPADPTITGDYTRYYLTDRGNPRRIEVYVLKDYLKEKLGIEFTSRSESDLIGR